jgi:hypothetical protein
MSVNFPTTCTGLGILGLNQYENETSRIGGALQWKVAGTLIVVYNFIMKEIIIKGLMSKQKGKEAGSDQHLSARDIACTQS